MKLITLSNNLLKHMVRSYSENHEKLFYFDQFKTLYPDLEDDFISDALYLLQHDGFIQVQSADDVAYYTVLKVNAVRDAEENTFLKKGYTVLKEIRSWI